MNVAEDFESLEEVNKSNLCNNREVGKIVLHYEKLIQILIQQIH